MSKHFGQPGNSRAEHENILKTRVIPLLDVPELKGADVRGKVTAVLFKADVGYHFRLEHPVVKRNNQLPTTLTVLPVTEVYPITPDNVPEPSENEGALEMTKAV